VIDPVGAVLAVLVYEALTAAPSLGATNAARTMLPQLGVTVVVGLAIGAASAKAAIELLRSSRTRALFP